MTNELEKIAKKHRLSLSNKHARGWWINPNPGNPETMARFNNSTNIGAAQGQMTGGEAPGCCESVISANDYDKFFRDLGFNKLGEDKPLYTIDIRNITIAIDIDCTNNGSSCTCDVDILYSQGQFPMYLSFNQVKDIVVDLKSGSSDELILARSIMLYEYWSMNGKLGFSNEEKLVLSDKMKEFAGLLDFNCTLDIDDVIDIIDENY